MSYDPTTDFLGLLRRSGGEVETARAPGLDIVLAALARAGLFKLSVGQVAPITNQATTVWLRPAQPSWTAEGTLWLWNVSTSQYELATPPLFSQLLVVLQAPIDGSGFSYIGTQLMQWGSASVGNNYTTVPFPIRFGGTPRVQVTPKGADILATSGTGTVTQDDFTAAFAGVVPRDIDWFAIGPA